MEINRPASVGFAPVGETQGTARPEPKIVERDVESLQVFPSKENLRLDRMQQTLREMPDVDEMRIAEIRHALGRGDLNAETRLLAASIVSYHRGTDI